MSRTETARNSGAGRPPSGFTLLEIMVTAAILASMLIAVFAVLRTSARLARTGETLVDLQEYGRAALEVMVNDMRLAGRTTLGGKQYPRFGNFSDLRCTLNRSNGVARFCPNGLEATGYGVPTNYGGTVSSSAGDVDLRGSNIFFHHGLGRSTGSSYPHIILDPTDVDYGQYSEVSREILFILPAGVLSGTPSYTGSAPVFDDTEYAYVVAQGPDGINQLEKRSWDPTGVPPANYSRIVVARYVERLVIEDMGGAPDFNDLASNLTSNQLRLTIYLAKQVSGESNILRTKVSTVVVMRNSALD
jgi:prepilin-type N-terminal cleavage/methylation domain-containing protein